MTPFFAIRPQSAKSESRIFRFFAHCYCKRCCSFYLLAFAGFGCPFLVPKASGLGPLAIAFSIAGLQLPPKVTAPFILVLLPSLLIAIRIERFRYLRFDCRLAQN